MHLIPFSIKTRNAEGAFAREEPAMSRFKTSFLFGAALLPAAIAAVPVAHAQTPAASAKNAATISEAIAASKPLLDLRVRFEGVEQAGLAQDADALTWRLRAGFETGVWNKTSFLLDFDLVEDLSGDFNSTTNGKTAYPVVPDPSTAELNRLQLTTGVIPKTKVTIGRQRIVMDDARFVGNVGWRQNEQTFDAVRVTNTALGKLVIDAAYVSQVNRVFGEESAQGRFTGDTYLVNVSHPTPLGKLTGFAYLVDADQAGGVNASETYGARFAGNRKVGGGTIDYALSWATQGDFGSSNLDYGADYYLVSAGYSQGPVSAGLGYEVLGGDTARGFQTPLATLHAFQGWADKFLVTPNGGVEDLYASIGYTVGDAGPVKGIRLLAVYHDFGAETLSASYGSELDLQATASVANFKLGLKYASYDADGFATDTDKAWAWIEYAF